MSTREVQGLLRACGWPLVIDGSYGPKTREAVWDFQRGYLFTVLVIDGKAGPQTWEALRVAVARGGRCSTHFRFKEFASAGNHWIKVHRRLVYGLEKYRERVGDFDFSGHRDAQYNAKIGGATQSQHLYGNAADLHAPTLTVAQVKALKVFSGIGYRASSGMVVHVDVRHVGPNTSGGTIAAPTLWIYT